MDENEIERDSFIFYRSFFEAIKKIENAKDKANAYDAICELALNGNEIELSGIADIIFPLIKPQIVANNKRYLNGCKEKQHGKAKRKQNVSKHKANENENVNENDNENVNDNDKWFAEFWSLYPKKLDKKKAKIKFDKICKNERIFKIIIAGLKKQMQSDQWTKDNGQFIPYPTTWLNGERWNDEIETTVATKDERREDYEPIETREDDICF